MKFGKVHLSGGTEDPLTQAPLESLVLAYAAMVPIAFGAVACLVLNGWGAVLAVHLTATWSGAVLCFLSGVRRGLSFRQEGGPLVSQLGTMLWLFVLGAASLLSPWPAVSLGLQTTGYATMAFYDPLAARRGEAPRYFQTLRPAQMLIPVISLMLILLSLVV